MLESRVTCHTRKVIILISQFDRVTCRKVYEYVTLQHFRGILLAENWGGILLDGHFPNLHNCLLVCEILYFEWSLW